VRAGWLALAIAWLAQPVARAEDQPTVPAGFEATGEIRKCLPAHEIRETRVLDDRTILFRAHVSDYYLNRLPRECPELRLEGRFAYKLRGTDDLCDVDTITVLNSSGTGPACLLGKFEALKKKKP
jgi:hypothetical protein